MRQVPSLRLSDERVDSVNRRLKAVLSEQAAALQSGVLAGYAVIRRPFGALIADGNESLAYGNG